MLITAANRGVETFGQDANRDVLAQAALDGEQGLMLLRAQPHLARGTFAKLQKSPQVIAKLSQALIIQLIERLASGHR